MRVTLDLKDSETIKIDVVKQFDFKVDSEKILYQGFHKNIIIDKVWDSHGDIVNFDDVDENGNSKKLVFNNKTVTVKEITTSYDWQLNGKREQFTSWQLSIDDKVIDGDVYKYKGTKNSIRIQLCVGSG